VKVLVVDDSKAIRSVLGRIMREVGFSVCDAGHGIEALEQLEREGPFDLALVDWNMPQMNGYDFIRTARARYPDGTMQIMMVTSESEMPQVVRALEAGANEYIMKPFTAEALREKLGILGLYTT